MVVILMFLSLYIILTFLLMFLSLYNSNVPIQEMIFILFSDEVTNDVSLFPSSG
jgi:hypothetical protein